MPKAGVYGPTAERLFLAERVAELRAQGLRYTDVAERLGISKSYAHALATDADGSKARARKDTYTGECVDCGGPTSGSDGRGHAPERCEGCRRAFQMSDDYTAPTLYWTRERIIAAIHDFAAETGEPPATPDWNPNLAVRLGDLTRARRAEIAIAGRRWPWFTLVVRRFGSWNAGIEAAGFEPRVPHGGGGNGQRRRSCRSLQATEGSES